MSKNVSMERSNFENRLYRNDKNEWINKIVKMIILTEPQYAEIRYAILLSMIQKMMSIYPVVQRSKEKPISAKKR